MRSEKNTGGNFIPVYGLVLLILLFSALLAGCGGENNDQQSASDQADSDQSQLVPAGVQSYNEVAANADSTSLATDADAAPENLATDNTDADISHQTGTLSDSDGVGEPAKKRSEQSPAAQVPTTISGGPYSLQLGSFGNVAAAGRRAESIRQLGYDPTIEAADVGGTTYHRVFVRGLADKEEASTLGEHLHTKLGITYLIRRRS